MRWLLGLLLVPSLAFAAAWTTTTGGKSQTNTADYGFIGGGESNTLNSGAHSVVTGGKSNTNGGQYSVIDGGWNNSVSASVVAASILGGQDNVADVNGSIVMGRGAKGTIRDERAMAAEKISTTGDAQVSEAVLRDTTTDATATDLCGRGVCSAGRLLIPSGSTWSFMVQIVARRTDVVGDEATYTCNGLIHNNSGTTALAATATYTSVVESGDTSWDATCIANDTQDALKVQVQGAAGKTVRWVAYARLVRVSG